MESLPALEPIAVVVIASVTTALVLGRLRLPAVAGCWSPGAVIGPRDVAMVKDSSPIEALKRSPRWGGPPPLQHRARIFAGAPSRLRTAGGDLWRPTGAQAPLTQVTDPGPCLHDAAPRRVPPFGDTPYPAEIHIEEPIGPRDKLSVDFRLILILPHLALLPVLLIAWAVVALVSWLAILVTGRLVARAVPPQEQPA